MTLIIESIPSWDIVEHYYNEWNSQKIIWREKTESYVALENVYFKRKDYRFYADSKTANPLIVVASYDENMIGTCSLFVKKYEHMVIGGIGRMAVSASFRQYGVARELLYYMKIVMERRNIDVSMLWASVLRVYESVGYKAYFKNMMLLPVKKNIEPWMIPNLLEAPKTIGTW